MSTNSPTSAVSPPGPVALGPSSRGDGIIAAWVVMMTFASITVALRFYTRRFILRVLGIEDWLILVALVLHAAFPRGFTLKLIPVLLLRSCPSERVLGLFVVSIYISSKM
jgi:hypothetical protein